jgi:hypothetical protein
MTHHRQCHALKVCTSAIVEAALRQVDAVGDDSNQNQLAAVLVNAHPFLGNDDEREVYQRVVVLLMERADHDLKDFVRSTTQRGTNVAINFGLLDEAESYQPGLFCLVLASLKLPDNRLVLVILASPYVGNERPTTEEASWSSFVRLSSQQHCRLMPIGS